MKTFGELFSDSWKEYKKNFNLFFKIFLIWFIPSIIIGFIQYFFPFSGTKAFIFLPLGIIILVILNIIVTLSFLYIALYKTDKFDKAVKGGLSYFWRYVGLMIIMGVLLILLSLLLIIPGIIFLVYWVFSPYILVKENKGIWESMKESKKIIKKKWWKTLGFILLIGLIMMGISVLFYIPSIIFYIVIIIKSIPYIIMTGQLPPLSAGLSLVSWLLDTIAGFVYIVTGPLSILFFKNFYLNMKRK